jgi:DNA-directed RNA polymerase subunit M/transcription elongation factor TFIIS
MAVSTPMQCPRCTGSMLAESDAHGVFSTCLACGYVYESRVISVFELEQEQAVEEGRQRRRQPSHGKLRL